MQEMLSEVNSLFILQLQKPKVGFVKYQGLGNDFLLVDNRDRSEPSLSPEQAAKLCDRNFGVGGDGVIFVLPGKDGSDYTMRIYNSDSSEPEVSSENPIMNLFCS